MMIQAPCKDCEERQVGCHSTCEKYAEYKACMNVFGLAYELTDRFNCRRKKCLPDFMQMTISGEIKRGDND